MTRFFRLVSALLALSASIDALAACSSSDSPSGGGGSTSAGSAGQAQSGGGTGATVIGGHGGALAGMGAVSSTAGAGGSAAGGSTAGAAGGSTADASGGSTAGASGGSATQPSTGCGMPVGQVLDSWVEQPKLSVMGVDRRWWVWLPKNYDSSKAYPVVFLFHGCSAADNVVPMQNVTNEQAILVRGAGVSDGVCWDASANGPDVLFFDQMLTTLTAERCADTKHVFAAGYSSGSWLVNTLDCKRADKLRAAGSVSGGSPGANGCSGTLARIFIHDFNDTTNVIAGSVTERDRLLALNHCSTTTVPTDPAPCIAYQGCDAGLPIVWCETMGKGHDRQDALAPGAFWTFFSKL
jgi:polyhydroxybutyrate depolymerase